MSGRIKAGFVDFVVFSSEIDRVRCVPEIEARQDRLYAFQRGSVFNLAIVAVSTRGSELVGHRLEARLETE